MISQPNTLDAALALAQRGFYVFPCDAAGQRKKPSIKNWKAEATRDEAQIRKWWGGTFAGCAIGIAHGKFGDGADYLVTVDCDNKHGKNGADRLFELELEHGDLPRTYTQRTQSGGSHLVFKTKYPLKNGVDVRPGLDIRGARGLIYAAGSVWNGKAYTIERDADVAEAPDWLVQLAGIQAPKELKETVAEGVALDTDDQIKRAKEYLETTREAVRGNAGDERVLQVAMKVGDMGVSQYECLDLMQKHFADRCVPPLDPAYLEQKVENAYAYREEPLGNALASQDFTDEPTIPVEKAPRPKLYIQEFDDVEPRLTDAYLMQKLLDDESMSVVYGESNTGKTFFAMAAAFAIATGTPFASRKTSKGAAVYVAAEAGVSAKNRVAALRKHFKAKHVAFGLVACPVDLLRPTGDAQALIELVREYEAKHGKVRLIVVDTLSRAIAGGNENSPDDMGALVKHLDAIRVATKAHVMVIHHSGKDAAKGARGHSLLRAATDTEIEIANGVARATKQRDMEMGKPIGFDLAVVTLGKSSEGEDVTSCVCIPNENTSAAEDFANMKAPLAGDDANIMALLKKAGGQARTDAIRVRFVTDRAKRVKDAKRKTHGDMFGRSVRKLVAQGYVAKKGDMLETCKSP